LEPGAYSLRWVPLRKLIGGAQRFYVIPLNKNGKRRKEVKRRLRVRTNCLDFVALLTSNSSSLQSTEEGRDDKNTQTKEAKNGY
jgi:hypothetical protein